ncbi:nucleolar protein dao-5 isoform X3 [Nilaparvata lugens]|uniref:nucleolar protein dao-5 isoform X3 n=1 Tax=Nilaparvata lugens TaxID=108931 RepID=UPI00193D84EB|nr:nucleolar protein dao-5 isoform X3 [Nilaparvata lugens]
MEEPKALPNGHSDSHAEDKPDKKEIDEVEPTMKDDKKTDPKKTKSDSDEASNSPTKSKNNELEKASKNQSFENALKQIEKSAIKKKIPQKIVKRSPRISRNKEPPEKSDEPKSEDKGEKKSDDKPSENASNEEEKGSKEADEAKKEVNEVSKVSTSKKETKKEDAIDDVKKSKAKSKDSKEQIKSTGDPDADFLGFEDPKKTNYSSNRDKLKKMIDELTSSTPGSSRSRRSTAVRSDSVKSDNAKQVEAETPKATTSASSAAVKTEPEPEAAEHQSDWFDRQMRGSLLSQSSYYGGCGDDDYQEGSGVSNAMLIPEVVYNTGGGGGVTGISHSSVAEESRSRRTARPSLAAQSERKPSPTVKRNFDVTLPQYLKPFEYGWKRELAYRNNTETVSKRMADVFYYTPLGKKIRSIGAVSDYLLGTDLTLENFTFVTKSMNLNDPNKETIRDPRTNKGERPPPVIPPPTPVTTRKSSLLSKANAAESAENAEESPKTSSLSTPKISLKSFRPSPKIKGGKTPVPEKKAKKGSSDDSDNDKDELEMGMLPPLWHESIRPDWSANGSTTLNTKPEKIGGKRPLEADKPETEAATAGDSSQPVAKRIKTEPDEEPADAAEPVASPTVPTASPTVPADPTPDKMAPESSRSVPDTLPISRPVPIASSSVSVNKDFFMNNVSAIYHALLNSFQYLKVQELLRAARVCHMWRDVAMNRSLWHVVRLKNSRVRDWEGLGAALRQTGARHLDLRKMLMPPADGGEGGSGGGDAVADMWQRYASAIDRVTSLARIDLCRCPATAVQRSASANHRLQYLSALAIKSSSLDASAFENCRNMTELRLKSSEKNGLVLENLSALKHLTKMKHLSLTTMKSFSEGLAEALENMKDLETLELGECSELTSSVATRALPKLKRLQRLRLEKGQGAACPTLAILESVKDLKSLVQLELINFDIKAGFDTTIAKCSNLRTLLIIPTYVTQSATTNHLVMEGVSKLSKTLTLFVWGITLELLRVTDLFIDQWEGQKGAAKSANQKKGAGDSIPILKPITETSSYTGAPSQVDILQLPKLHKVLTSLLKTTKVKILKVPFSATWRQTVSGPAHIH